MKWGGDGKERGHCAIQTASQPFLSGSKFFSGTCGLWEELPAKGSPLQLRSSPEGQMQLKPLTRSRQMPPLTHGLLWHSSMSTSQ